MEVDVYFFLPIFSQPMPWTPKWELTNLKLDYSWLNLDSNYIHLLNSKQTVIQRNLEPNSMYLS